MTRYFIAFILSISTAHASELWGCIPPISEGYWTADGPPGIVEIWLDTDGTASTMYRIVDPTKDDLGLFDLEGNWRCLEDDKVEVEFPDMRLIFSEGKSYFGGVALIGEKSEFEYFSERVFVFTGY